MIDSATLPPSLLTAHSLPWNFSFQFKNNSWLHDMVNEQIAIIFTDTAIRFRIYGNDYVCISIFFITEEFLSSWWHDICSGFYQINMFFYLEYMSFSPRGLCSTTVLHQYAVYFVRTLQLLEIWILHLTILWFWLLLHITLKIKSINSWQYSPSALYNSSQCAQLIWQLIILPNIISMHSNQ